MYHALSQALPTRTRRTCASHIAVVSLQLEVWTLGILLSTEVVALLFYIVPQHEGVFGGGTNQIHIPLFERLSGTSDTANPLIHRTTAK